jgi:flagellar biosynthesis protein
MQRSDNRPRRAVILRYDPKRDRTPKIAGTGQGLVAERILELARQFHIPVRQDKNLIQILARLEVHQEIPPEIYKAIAEIFAFVYRVSQRGANS